MKKQQLAASAMQEKVRPSHTHTHPKQLLWFRENEWASELSRIWYTVLMQGIIIQMW